MLWTAFVDAPGQTSCEAPPLVERLAAEKRQGVGTEPAAKRLKNAPQFNTSPLPDNSDLPDVNRPDVAGCSQSPGAAHHHSQATSGIESSAAKQSHNTSCFCPPDGGWGSSLEQKVASRVASVTRRSLRISDNTRVLKLWRAGVPCVTAPSGGPMAMAPLDVQQAHDYTQQALQGILGPQAGAVETPPGLRNGRLDVAVLGAQLPGGDGQGNCAPGAAAVASAAPLGGPFGPTLRHHNSFLASSSVDPALVPAPICGVPHDERHPAVGQSSNATAVFVDCTGLGGGTGLGLAGPHTSGSPSIPLVTGRLDGRLHANSDIKVGTQGGGGGISMHYSPLALKPSPPPPPLPGDTSSPNTARPLVGEGVGAGEGRTQDLHMWEAGGDTSTAAEVAAEVTGVTAPPTSMEAGAGGLGACGIGDPHRGHVVVGDAAGAAYVRRVQDLSYLYAVDEAGDPMLAALNRLYDMFRNDAICASEPMHSSTADLHAHSD